MTRAFGATIKQEITAARRDWLPQVILGVFLGMIAAASFIGWMTHITVTSVYNEALREGATHQPNPFLNAPQLDPVKNVVIYITLIGALFAILVGVQSMVRERKSRVLDLILTRPIGMRSYVLAKFTGIGVWLGIVLGVSAVLTWISLWIIQGHAVSASNCLQLLIFFGISWLFLLPFTALGMMSGLRSKQETTALLLPILVWVLIAFIVPQLGTAEEPVSFLNPVPAQPISHGIFFQTNRMLLQPVSFTDHYKELSGAVLHYRQGQSLVSQSLEFGLIDAITIIPLVWLSPKLIRKGELYE